MHLDPVIVDRVHAVEGEADAHDWDAFWMCGRWAPRWVTWHLVGSLQEVARVPDVCHPFALLLRMCARATVLSCRRRHMCQRRWGHRVT